MHRLSRLNAQTCVIISSMPRKYEMKRRAERVQETRRRITEAAVELHQTVGPARTTVSVIADAFEASGERHEALLGAIALAQDFQTWRTLVRQQELGQDRAVELMVGMVRCLMRT